MFERYFKYFEFSAVAEMHCLPCHGVTCCRQKSGHEHPSWLETHHMGDEYPAVLQVITHGYKSITAIEAVADVAGLIYICAAPEAVNGTKFFGFVVRRCFQNVYQ